MNLINNMLSQNRLDTNPRDIWSTEHLVKCHSINTAFGKKSQDKTHHQKDEAGASGDSLVPDGLREGGLLDTRDRVLLQVGGLGSEVRPRTFLLFLEAHAVPVVRQAGRFPLPVLQECHSWKWTQTTRWFIKDSPFKYSGIIKGGSEHRTNTTKLFVVVLH